MTFRLFCVEPVCVAAKRVEAGREQEAGPGPGPGPSGGAVVTLTSIHMTVLAVTVLSCFI